MRRLITSAVAICGAKKRGDSRLLRAAHPVAPLLLDLELRWRRHMARRDGRTVGEYRGDDRGRGGMVKLWPQRGPARAERGVARRAAHRR